MPSDKDLKAVFEDDHSLEHYGVMGMKWGVWNAETARKRTGGSGGKFKRVKKAAASSVRSIRERRAAAKETKQIAQEQAIKVGQMKSFSALRKKTLASHDPEVVEKGMHTLTDAELSAKISRLSQEKVIRDLANNKRQGVAETRRKQEEALAAEKNRKASGMGASMLKTTYNATAAYAGKRIVDDLFDAMHKTTKA